jgi:hypothetical protein
MSDFRIPMICGISTQGAGKIFLQLFICLLFVFRMHTKKITDALHLPMSFAPLTVSFLQFQIGSQVYVFDSTANCYFSVNSFRQHLLVPVDTNLVPVSTCSQPAAIALHRLLLTTSPQMHDYTAENRMLYRLAKATWPTGKTLHCTNSGDICRLHQEVLAIILEWSLKLCPIRFISLEPYVGIGI